MIYSAILVSAVVLLVAFAIERLGKNLGFPSVIVMVVVGLAAKPLVDSMGYAPEGLDTAVPILGTVGLVLIVLEGALDVELRRSRMKLMVGAFSMAVAGFLLCLVGFSWLASTALSFSTFQAVLLAVPFAVISSAVAIPSSDFLPSREREFVVYETSVSDILGVLVFFALLNSDGSIESVLSSLAGGGLLSLLLSVVCALGLVLVLVRIDGHIRFIPLLAGLFGLYAIGKLLHLSPLIMVLLFGLALNNPELLRRFAPLRRWIDNSYDDTLKAFKVLVLELTFAVRGYFFILLGYWTDVADLGSVKAWLSAMVVLLLVFGTRYLLLKASRHRHAEVLTWIAPRGLITVLLFLRRPPIFSSTGL
ncbi:MAG: hypothetical protein JNM32_00005 [Dechloromonas sp.]|nr:hypothetical protein [Dechloromonas sp.]